MLICQTFFLLEFFIGLFISNYLVLKLKLNKKFFKPKYQINVNLPDLSYLVALTENKDILERSVGCLSKSQSPVI